MLLLLVHHAEARRAGGKQIGENCIYATFKGRKHPKMQKHQTKKRKN